MPAEADPAAPIKRRLPLLRVISFFWPLLLVIFAFWLVIGIGSTSHNLKLDAVLDLPSITQCTKDTLAVLDHDQVAGPAALRQALEHCYSLIRSQGLLNDFAVRELTFIQQYRSSAILMWMVVVITLSGVGLAAIQLFASYQLAAQTKYTVVESELSVERNKLILKSSVTGLFILAISFAFFLVYVTNVYQLQATDTAKEHIPAAAGQLSKGQLTAPQ